MPTPADLELLLKILELVEKPEEEPGSFTMRLRVTSFGCTSWQDVQTTLKKVLKVVCGRFQISDTLQLGFDLQFQPLTNT